jgi:thiamine-monophosphate kinase
MTKNARPDEDTLIARYFRPLATAPGAALLLDDAASYIPPDNHEVVLTNDALIAGVHFFPDDPPDAVARKALRVNISDLAAKGARPVGYLLTLALPENWTDGWLESFAEGLSVDQEEYGLSLFGGDTVKTPGPFWLSITAFGVIPEGCIVRRQGAIAGQRLYVTGTIGDAALGLRLRQDSALKNRWHLDMQANDHLLDRYLLPEPRVLAAPLILRFASASMDISDGLIGDIQRMCLASNVGAVIEVERIPLSPAASQAVNRDAAALATVLTGGDDYEILCAVDPDAAEGFEQEAAEHGMRVTAIGTLTAPFADSVRVERHGRPLILDKLAYHHF